MLPALFFFLWIALAVLSLLEFHTSFRIVCSGSVKKVMDNFNSSHIKSIDCFGQYGHVNNSNSYKPSVWNSFPFL